AQPRSMNSIWQQFKVIWPTRPDSMTHSLMRSSTQEKPAQHSANGLSVSSTLFASQHPTTLPGSVGCGRTFISTSSASSMEMTRRNPFSLWTNWLPKKPTRIWFGRLTRSTNLQRIRPRSLTRPARTGQEQTTNPRTRSHTSPSPRTSQDTNPTIISRVTSRMEASLAASLGTSLAADKARSNQTRETTERSRI
ncbi:hypothetical protein BGZ95_008732, partial [Linnemannia exigua]